MAFRFPYGLARFPAIRTQGMVYVDRTAHIRNLEELGHILVFLRPRRFGKSLWLDTLAAYYDVRRKDDFDTLFGDLDIGRAPTPQRNRYLVFRWDFSRVAPRGTADAIAASLQKHVQVQARTFVRAYKDHLEDTVDLEDTADAILNGLLDVAQAPLYLLIDEYDNFINAVMTRDETVYRDLLESDGPFKLLFKSVKAATQRGIERVFITGVSPIALNDLTSGFNNAKDVTHDPSLAQLCGFSAEEIQMLLVKIAEDQGLAEDTIRETARILRIWYNGYRFVRNTQGLVYNPTNTFYFLDYYARYGTAPERLHDTNLRMDRSKLEFLAQKSASSPFITALAETGKSPLPVAIEESFSLHDLTSGIREDEHILGSFLFYLGLVTLSDGVLPHLQIPNLAIRKVFLDRLLNLFVGQRSDMRTGKNAATQFFEDGDIQSVIAYLEDTLLPILSNRDKGSEPKRSDLSGSGVNETSFKALLLAILFDDYRYYAFSEPEIGRGYIDLCLIVRPELRAPERFDILFELKLVRKKALGKSTEDLQAMTENELKQLPAVKTAFDEANEQVTRYKAALKKRFGDLLNLRCFSLVAVDLQRILVEEHSGE